MTERRVIRPPANEGRLRRWAGAVALVALSLAVMPGAAARNAGSLSLLRQVNGQDWSAWGLGLRTGQAPGTMPETGPNEGQPDGGTWADRDSLGIAGVWRE